MADLASREFWRAFADLPDEVQRLARTTFRTFQSNPDHPSLGRKKVQGKPAKFPPGAYEVRVGAHYRAFYIVRGQDREWLWIASHEEASKALRRRNDGGGVMACACGCKGKCRCRAGCKCRRAGNPCGKRPNPMTRRSLSGLGIFTVSFSPQEIANVKRSWPCSRLPSRGIQVVLDRHGDFVVARPVAAMRNADEQAVQILVESARKHLQEAGKIRSGNPPRFHKCPLDEDDRPRTPDATTCGSCGRSWCFRCHPTPASLCPWCNGDDAGTSAIPPSQMREIARIQREQREYRARHGNPRGRKPFSDEYRRALAFFGAQGRWNMGSRMKSADTLAQAERVLRTWLPNGDQFKVVWEQDADDPAFHTAILYRMPGSVADEHAVLEERDWLESAESVDALGGIDLGPSGPGSNSDYQRVIEAELMAEYLASQKIDARAHRRGLGLYKGPRPVPRRNPSGPIETFMHLDDQPFTCPHCGGRTEWSGKPEKAIHTCKSCGAKMRFEFGDTRDFNPASRDAGELDEHGVRELRLFIENDSQLYHSQTVPIQRNLMLKRKRGVYDREKALGIWRYLVEAGAKKYVKDYGTPDFPWWKQFPADVRTQVQRELRDHFEEEAALGNYDDLLDRKKYEAIVSRR